jgi:uncharacterized membrane protein YraQ (UPF0718 family)
VSSESEKNEHRRRLFGVGWQVGIFVAAAAVGTMSVTIYAWSFGWQVIVALALVGSSTVVIGGLLGSCSVFPGRRWNPMR